MCSRAGFSPAQRVDQTRQQLREADANQHAKPDLEREISLKCVRPPCLFRVCYTLISGFALICNQTSRDRGRIRFRHHKTRKINTSEK
jgi:hypothetical protein